MKRGGSGFTLVELLVVIAIIGLLSSIVMVSLLTARQKGRDAKRIADLKTIGLALAAYHLDHGSYPATGTTLASLNGHLWYGNCNLTSAWGSGNMPNMDSGGTSGWIPGLAPTYIPLLPSDPTPSTNKCYIYNSDGNDYMILAYQSVESYTVANNPYPRPLWDSGGSYAVLCPGGYAYEADFAVYSDGGTCW